MRNSTLHSALRILAIVLGITVASQASARYFHNPSANTDRIMKITYTPATGFTSFNNASSELGMLRIPVPSFAPMMVFCGGGHDSTGGDTTGGSGNDTLGGGNGDHGNGGPGNHDGDDGGDSTHAGNDTSHWGNDTIECGGHHHADNDTTAVTDTNAHTLFNGGNESITVKSHGAGANIVLTFTNNLRTSVTVSNMALASGRYFTIISGAPSKRNPVKLPPGGSISLKVAFNAADYIVHTDQLVVATNSASATNTIALQGVQIASASVSNSLPSGVTITALPNPMTSRLKVDLSGVNSAAVVIYDISGKTVLSTSITSSEWIWNGTASDGSMLVAGTYIVRLNGTSTEGAPFVTTQKIILAR
jgi:hypothetical protein